MNRRPTRARRAPRMAATLELGSFTLSRRELDRIQAAEDAARRRGYCEECGPWLERCECGTGEAPAPAPGSELSTAELLARHNRLRAYLGTADIR